MDTEEEKTRRFERRYSLVLHLAAAVVLYAGAVNEESRWGAAGMFALVAVAIWERNQRRLDCEEKIRRLTDELSVANEKAWKLDELLKPPF